MAKNTKRRIAGKTAMTIVAALLCLLSVLYLSLSLVFGFWNPLSWGKSNVGGGQIDTNNPNPDEIVSPKDLGLTVKRIAKSDYAAYGISEQAEEANQLIVELTPANGMYGDLQLSLAWEDSSNPALEGHGVEAFVVLNYYDTVSLVTNEGPNFGISGNSGPFLLSLVKYQSFPEPVILTCTLNIRDGESVTKTVRIECVSTVTSIFGSSDSSGPSLTGGSLILDSFKQPIKANCTYGAGTLTPNSATGSITFKLNDSLVSDLTTLSYNFVSGFTGTFTYGAEKLLDENFSFGFELDKILEGEYNETQFWNDFYTIIQQKTGIVDGTEPLFSITTSDVQFYYNETPVGDAFTISEGSFYGYVSSYEDLATWATGFELSKDLIIL